MNNIVVQDNSYQSYFGFLVTMQQTCIHKIVILHNYILGGFTFLAGGTRAFFTPSSCREGGKFFNLQSTAVVFLGLQGFFWSAFENKTGKYLFHTGLGLISILTMRFIDRNNFS